MSKLIVQEIGKSADKTVDSVAGQAKAFAVINADGTAITESFNVSSYDDDGTGDGGVNFTNNMSNATYNVASITENADGPAVAYRFPTIAEIKAAAGVEIQAGYLDTNSGSVAFDFIKNITVFGTLI